MNGTETKLQDLQKNIMNQNIEESNYDYGKDDLWDWDKYEAQSVRFMDGYIRNFVEKEFRMTVPKEINPLIAKYCVYIMCILFQ